MEDIQPVVFYFKKNDEKIIGIFHNYWKEFDTQARILEIAREISFSKNFCRKDCWKIQKIAWDQINVFS